MALTLVGSGEECTISVSAPLTLTFFPPFLVIVLVGLGSIGLPDAVRQGSQLLPQDVLPGMSVCPDIAYPAHVN